MVSTTPLSAKNEIVSLSAITYTFSAIFHCTPVSRLQACAKRGVRAERRA